MFTGIIEELGEVESVGARLKVRCSTVVTDMTEGASIAVNGVCLTAVDPRPGAFHADLAPETLRRSNLGELRPGSRVNLECDILAKHVEKLLRKLDVKSPLTVDKLRENGY